jgi:aspartate/methionine/tyrosine aminotransferase
LVDAIGKLYKYHDPEARILIPTPLYSTHLLGEGGHAGQAPLVYHLDPENGWKPDPEEIRNQVRKHPGIAGILIINPDNPTGMVYPEDALRAVVAIAREQDLFLIADEIYTQITYNGVRAVPLARVIGDVCGISMKGVSKEFPWPGARCGWLEFYNTARDPEFARLVKTIEDAKMLEVCSTTLPQLAIPPVLGDPRFAAHREALNRAIAERNEVVYSTLADVPGLIVNRSNGAFYNTVVFRPGALKAGQKLAVPNAQARGLVEGMVEGVPLDKRFVYYVLAATGICVVPLSSFGSELLGFRVTLLEEDAERMRWIYRRLRAAIEEYLAS